MIKRGTVVDSVVLRKSAVIENRRGCAVIADRGGTPCLIAHEKAIYKCGRATEVVVERSAFLRRLVVSEDTTQKDRIRAEIVADGAAPTLAVVVLEGTVDDERYVPARAGPRWKRPAHHVVHGAAFSRVVVVEGAVPHDGRTLVVQHAATSVWRRAAQDTLWACVNGATWTA